MFDMAVGGEACVDGRIDMNIASSLFEDSASDGKAVQVSIGVASARSASPNGEVPRF
jgi:hypothetical protein